MAISNVDPNNVTLDLEWGGDLVLNSRGGLALVYGWPQIRQRILRGLLTNPSMVLADGTPGLADYIYHQDYGSGLLRKMGEPYNDDLRLVLEAKIIASVKRDVGSRSDVVDVNREPIVLMAMKNQRVLVSIEVPLMNRPSEKINFSFKA